MGDIGLLSAGIFSSCALIYSAPAALPERKAWSSTRDAFMTSLALSGTFLLGDGVWMLSDSLWGTSSALILCAVSVFIISEGFAWALFPEINTSFLAASALVPVLSQPRFPLWGQSALSALGTALGIVILITALSPAMRRISLSDAPQCVRGIPSLLFILGIAALAFAAF